MTRRRPADPPEIALARADGGAPSEALPPGAGEGTAEETEEAVLLELEPADETLPGEESLATGRAAIIRAVKHAPNGPGVYRMIAADGTVLYVGKAKSIKKRVLSYTRPVGHTNRIARMIAGTAQMEFVSTRTEPEALLLEANLIKQLKPRFNVLLRDDKSFPYILITADHVSPQIAKHRGARNRPGDYYGPFASVWAVDRTINALERAFLLRSCSDSYYENRTRPCLLFQIKRCAGPCTGEVSHQDYAELVREARAFLSGRSRAIKEELAKEMEQAAEELEFERAARLRDRLAALSAVQGSQGINPRGVEEADVFACHQQGGATCVEVFFFRTGQNWGNRAYYPRADRSLTEAEVLGAFLAQFYEDKPCPRLLLLSHKVEEQELLAEALSEKAGYRVEIAVPQRGEKRDLVDHALQNAREALARTLAESATQAKLLEGVAATFGLKAPPQRIEVYDNSHIMGTNAVGGMIVAGPEGFRKSQYRKFNIKSADLVPGDDFGMMREVLTRRFARLLKEAPREAVAVAEAAPPSPPPSSARGEGAPAVQGGDTEDHPAPIEAAAGTEASPEPPLALGGEVRGGDPSATPPAEPEVEDEPDAIPDATGASPWPDLVLIDGGLGQLNAARKVLEELGITDVPLVGIAKGLDREAGREQFFLPGRTPFRMEPRDPVLYYIQRLRDEAHRFAIGSHRARRKKDITEAGLQAIPGVGPTRKRALLRHFGTLKAIERASLADLEQVAGVNAGTAKAVYDYFHERPSS
ncbi:excinuclease ABC subunit UvrC [Xanthobacter autotrophicus]|uniref:excinuclease ABC subunit UvrC n=1 Tax=Xanthobacter autotrophicus TaxID=280 RepID=UPI001E37AA1D|nr:excinuclease ABC subunit UvrC [Xanthobacter autotrophicus]UDQ91243.1 excinuclease ABC subunit UvrC [Xanthobacter autotrophicus]